MNILITNDDGIHAQGLQELYRSLSAEYTTYIIAPDSEKSACSNAITTHRSVKVKQEDEHIFAVAGYPADCVNIGLHAGIIPAVDVIISGINHGPNVGNDVVFSGTVAGARTAFIYGKNGIAVSLDSYHKPSAYFSDAADFILKYIREQGKSLLNKPRFLNINYPDVPVESIRGIAYTHLGTRVYRDTYEKEIVSVDEMNLNLNGDFDYVHDTGSDVTMLKNRYISITPLGVDTTDKLFLQENVGRN